jgi:hypothetical protein
MNNKYIETNEERILSRSMARELSEEEMEFVSGGFTCTKSTCSGSDNNSCDLDQCGDTN